jgi:hypothetical protein
MSETESTVTRPRRGVAGIALLIVVLVGAAFAVRSCESFLGVHNPFAARTTDRSQPVLLKSIQDISRYDAATANLQVVIDVEKDAKFIPSAVWGQRTLFVAAGTVDAYVDFRGIAERAITVSKDGKSATIRLPHPALGKPNLDHEHSYVVTQQRGIINRVQDFLGSDPNRVQQLNVLAEKKLTAAAQASELVEHAEKNTKGMLEGMLHSLGYTSVDVQFVSP